MSTIRTCTVIALSIVALFFFTACEIEPVVSDAVKKGNTGGGAGSMSAKINGRLWQSNVSAATIANGQTSIGGKTDNGEALVITLTDDDIGVYTLNATAFHAAAYTEFTGAVAHTSNANNDVEGTVEITEINYDEKWISGIFSFDGFRFTDSSTVNITEGQFTKIPISDGTVGAGNSNTMTLKVDGQEWRATSVRAIASLGTLGVSGTSNDNNKIFAIRMAADVVPGTYDLGLGFDYLGSVGTTGSIVTFNSDSGELIVTKHDTQNRLVEGTFHYVAREFGGTATLEVTNGSFSAKY